MGVVDEGAVRDLHEAIGGDAATMRELFGSFFEQSPKLLSEGRMALDRGDAKTLLRVAHTIKSSAALFGAKNLSQMCRELEKDCSGGMPHDAAPRLAAIEAEYARVKVELDAWTPA